MFGALTSIAVIVEYLTEVAITLLLLILVVTIKESETIKMTDSLDGDAINDDNFKESH